MIYTCLHSVGLLAPVYHGKYVSKDEFEIVKSRQAFEAKKDYQ